MKKFIKRAPRKPIGRNPVISCRVPGPTYDVILRIADRQQQSLSEAMLGLIQRGLDWDLALEAGLLDKGFQRLHGSPHWVKLPEVTPKSGFIPPGEEEAFLHPTAATETKDGTPRAGRKKGAA